jgi:hypothetical protein
MIRFFAESHYPIGAGLDAHCPSNASFCSFSVALASNKASNNDGAEH